MSAVFRLGCFAPREAKREKVLGRACDSSGYRELDEGIKLEVWFEVRRDGERTTEKEPTSIRAEKR